MPLQERVRFTTPSYGFKIRESSAATAARQPGSTLARGTELDFMTALEEVKESVTDIASRHRHDSEEFYMRHQDAQDDRAVLRACISTLARERRYYCHMAIVAYREAMYARQAWTHSMDHIRESQAKIRVLQAETRALQQQRRDDHDMLLDRVADALADYEANRGSGNGHDSHHSGSGSGRTPNTARVCTYKDFLNCQPFNFKGTEGVVGLTQWFEKMESVFHISNCTVECQIKYATCTLLGSALTWWNSHVKTVGHDAAYGMP
ncbi:hypothetical protein Tco_0351713 [Tanacetum coccineum]